MTDEGTGENAPVETTPANGAQGYEGRRASSNRQKTAAKARDVSGMVSMEKAGAHDMSDMVSVEATEVQDVTDIVSSQASETRGSPGRENRSASNRKKPAPKTNEDVTKHLLAKLDSALQEVGRERLLREQAEADASHKLELAHERIRALEEEVSEQRELESALLSARQRVAELEVQLALRHEGRRERRHHSKRNKPSRRWWLFGR
jgi:hypothetical protein